MVSVLLAMLKLFVLLCISINEAAVIFFFQLNTALIMHNRSFTCVSNLSVLTKQKTRFKLTNKESVVALFFFFL